MILRPDTDGELVAAIGAACADARMQLDSRGLVALLLAERRFQNMPNKSTLADVLAVGARPCGRGRLDRMMGEALACGWMARATWRVPRVGRAPLYCFVLGLPEMVAAAVAEMLKSDGQ